MPDSWSEALWWGENELLARNDAFLELMKLFFCIFILSKKCTQVFTLIVYYLSVQVKLTQALKNENRNVNGALASTDR